MRCCDEFGNCRQGRDCPVRKQQQCQWCHGLGFDASGQRCAMTKRAQQDIVEVARELDLMRFMRIENGCLITD